MAGKEKLSRRDFLWTGAGILTSATGVGLVLKSSYDMNAQKAQYEREHFITQNEEQFYKRDMPAPAWEGSEKIERDDRQTGVLKTALEEFYKANIDGRSFPTISQLKVPGFDLKIPLYSHARISNSGDQKQLSDSLRKVFIAAFQNERFKNVLPFNLEHLEKKLNEITILFARIDKSMKQGGHITNDGKYVVINTNKQNELDEDAWYFGMDLGEDELTPELIFASTVIHEIGHKLGLGEGLTELFAEELIRSKDGTGARTFLGVQEMYEEAMTVLNPRARKRSDTNWLYNSKFERALLNHSKTDPKEFWRAAFSSNEEFGKIWDKCLGHIMTYDELLMMRTVNSKFVLEDKYANEFKQHFGEEWIEKFSQGFKIFGELITNERNREYDEKMAHFDKRHAEIMARANRVLSTPDLATISVEIGEESSDEKMDDERREQLMQKIRNVLERGSEEQEEKPAPEIVPDEPVKSPDSEEYKEFRGFIDETKKFVNSIGKINFYPGGTEGVWDTSLFPDEFKNDSEYLKQHISKLKTLGGGLVVAGIGVHMIPGRKKKKSDTWIYQPGGFARKVMPEIYKEDKLKATK